MREALIAAAPDMLETLKMIECALMPNDGSPDTWWEHREEVARVIAKAEGRSKRGAANTIVLSDEDRDVFVEALLNPAAPPKAEE